MIEILAKNWWFLAARGVFAVCFGLSVFSLREWSHASFFSAIAFTTIGILFAIFAFVAGILTLIAALRGSGEGKHAWVLALDGMATLALGILIFVLPALSFLVLLRMMAIWAVIVGICHLSVATHLRRHIADEWLLALAGIFSALFGVLLLTMWPRSALSLFYWMSSYAIFSGLVMLALSLRLRSFPHDKFVAHAS
jgi:uncharacterized membrane protein HdeD (DUF308 family)